jgi:hypothetical protein
MYIECLSSILLAPFCFYLVKLKAVLKRLPPKAATDRITAGTLHDSGNCHYYNELGDYPNKFCLHTAVLLELQG